MPFSSRSKSGFSSPDKPLRTVHTPGPLMSSAPDHCDDHGLATDNRKAMVWLAAILVVGLLLRLCLWKYRWINPDEGAHLMDGRLILDGLVPIVDYNSRQVLYAYMLAGLIKIVGPQYTLVRLGVLLLSGVTTCLVYAIGARLFSRRVGLLSAGIYITIPLAVIWSPIVHMEPFASLAASLAIYTLSRYLEPKGSERLLALVGLLLGIGFYIRESGLAVTFAVFCAITMRSWREPARLVRQVGILIAGFLVPCVALSVLYAPRLTPLEWWQSSLNPFGLVVKQLGNLVAAAGPDTSIRPAGQQWSRSVHYSLEIFSLNAYLLVGVALSVAFLIARLKRQGELRASRGLWLVLYPWILGLTLVYGYWSLHRGLFPQYCEEFLPVFAILLAFVLDQLFSKWTGSGSVGWGTLGLAICAVTAFVGFRLAPSYELSRPLYLAIPAVGLAWWQLGGAAAWRRWLGVLAFFVIGVVVLTVAKDTVPLIARGLRLLAVPAILGFVWLSGRSLRRAALTHSYPAYLGAVLLTAAAVFSFGAASAAVRPNYETPWSPESVQRVAAYLRAHSRPADEIMSGGVIWAFQADRRPFATISHPLSFALRPSADELNKLENEWASRLPSFVVLDGYTELTFGAVLPDLQDVLKSRYVLADSASGSRYPVLVYSLREKTTR